MTSFRLQTSFCLKPCRRSGIKQGLSKMEVIEFRHEPVTSRQAVPDVGLPVLNRTIPLRQAYSVESTFNARNFVINSSNRPISRQNLDDVTALPASTAHINDRFTESERQKYTLHSHKSAVYLRIQKWKNYWNRSTFAKVIVKIKLARFLWPTVYIHIRSNFCFAFTV